jgi:hypothetical protein
MNKSQLQDIEVIFKEIFKSVLDYDMYISTQIYQEDEYKSICNLLSKKINTLKCKCNAFINFNKESFISKYSGLLYRIHDILVGYYAKQFLDVNKLKECKSVHDVLFNSIFGISKPDEYFKFLPTIIFNEFVKGITYFQDDHNVDNPVYHRDASCGDKKLNSNQKFSIDITNSNISKLRKKKLTKTCYLERLIYDKIYLNVFHVQDLAHLNELKLMEILHDDYYRHYSLNCEIKFSEDGVYPEKLTIYTKVLTDAFGVFTSEEYYKKYNSDKVKCQLIKNGQIFDKIQTFEKEEAWLMKNS